MAGHASALITFSERLVAEDLDEPPTVRLWRPSYTACLIEQQLPVWVITPIGYAPDGLPPKIIVVSYGMHPRPAIADVFVVMAGLFGGSDTLWDLADLEGLLQRKGNTRWAQPSAQAPPLEEDDDDDDDDGGPIIASSGLFDEAIAIVTERCRVTIMAYPGSHVLRQRSGPWMRDLGIDTDEFRHTPPPDPYVS